MANLKVDETPILDKKGKAQSYPVGTIVMRAISTVPAGWLVCDGSVLNFSDYPALAAHLGAVYGGNGTTTFGLPKLCGQSDVRMPFSTIVTEATYPSSFGHTHDTSVTPNNVSGTIAHQHNNSRISTNNEVANHNHTNNAGYGGLSSAGPTQLRASSTNNTQYLNNVHTHGANLADSGTSNYAFDHGHNVGVHYNENVSHNHTVTRNTSNSTSGSNATIPLSVQLYFLIKT